MGKNQFLLEIDPLFTQNRALSFSPMSSRVTILLFWYVVPLSENQTSSAPGKVEIKWTDEVPNSTVQVKNV